MDVSKNFRLNLHINFNLINENFAKIVLCMVDVNLTFNINKNNIAMYHPWLQIGVQHFLIKMRNL